MRFTNSINIGKPVDKTFSFVSNLENIPKWNYSVISCVKVSEGQAEIGSTFKQQRRFLGRILEDTFVISEYETDKILTIRSIQATYPFVISYSFEPRGQSTQLLNKFELKAKRLMRLLDFALMPKVKKAVAANLSVLKKFLEADKDA